jgi:hypothetical protein
MIQVVWDLKEDPEGNYRHILEHDVTPEEVEEVLSNPSNPTATSRSSNFPMTFGWTSTGRHLAVVWPTRSPNRRHIGDIHEFKTHSSQDQKDARREETD